MTEVQELEELFRQQSYFEPEVLEAARQWADDVRPGLKKPGDIIDDMKKRNDVTSPMDILENRMAQFGITLPQSLAELAFAGIQMSKEAEQVKEKK